MVVTIFQRFFIKFKEYSADSSKMMGNLPASSWTPTGSCHCDTSGLFSLFIARILEGSGSFVVFGVCFCFWSIFHRVHTPTTAPPWLWSWTPLDPQNLLDSAFTTTTLLPVLTVALSQFQGSQRLTSLAHAPIRWTKVGSRDETRRGWLDPSDRWDLWA